MPPQDRHPDASTFPDWSREVGTGLYPALVPGAPVELPVYGFVLVVIPAHNEGERIVATLRSLREQTRHADAVIVVADNCSDDTVSLALAEGVTVIETSGNTDRKAGALNQALEALLPKLDPDDVILLMDADTRLNPNFIDRVTRTLWDDHASRELGGVGGVFMGDMNGWSLIQQLQKNEYVRYARKLGRRHGRALVLTGTGSILRVRVLREVIAARQSGVLPDDGSSRSVYDIEALTEDNELTLAVKALGYRVLSPKDCQVFTALMPTYSFLYQQRRRWQRGAMENLMSHGLHSYTAPYISKQVASYVAIMFLPFYVATLTTEIVRHGDHGLFPWFWVAVAVLYIVEQTWSVRRGGWRGVLITLLVVPEIIYSIFLDAVFLTSLLGVLVSRREQWGRGIDEESTDELALHLTVVSPKKPNTTDISHVVSRCAAAAALMFTVSIPIIPVFNLPTAWFLIAVFVLTGSVNTVIRLIPWSER